MVNIAELEESAMLLPDQDRARLASQLLQSLPAPLEDEDQGISEALKRDAELDQDCSSALSEEAFRSHFE